MDGDGLLPLIRRWALLLTAAAVAAGAVGYVAASRISPSYESRARLLVGPLNTDFDTLRASSVLTRTYAELVSSEQVIARAASSLGPGVGAEGLRRSLSVNPNDVTRILTIRATSRDPVVAARSVQAVAEELVRLTSGTPEAPAPPAGTVAILDPAETPERPVGPKTLVHVLLSMLAGALVALAIAFVIDSLGRGPAARRQRTARPVVEPVAGELPVVEPMPIRSSWRAGR